MRTVRIGGCGIVLAALVGATDAGAQAAAERPTVNAVLASEGPRIDGVLDDAAWRLAPVIDRFTQQEPREGESASERTEVRVVYDSGHIFIAVHAFDSMPSTISATEMRRDSDRLLNEDSFQLILDTFNDSRNGYVFVTSPLGAKLEEQITEEGEGNARGVGANSNINRDWDGVWNVAARITEDGWIAEIEIPTTTLRFLALDEQTWGINFMRTIRRTNEVVYWAPIPKAYSLARVSLAGRLSGLHGLSHGMDLKLKPFVVGGGRDNHMTPSRSTSALHDAGFDARYGVSAGLNLDVTVNTDFAQVEADVQQVNLTRFSLLFPEKREFFLENAALFNMGTGNGFGSAQAETNLFFSRRIGLSDTGTPIPILAGARLAGKSGAHNIGLLNIQTESAFGRPSENFLVARYSRDILTRSRIGALFVNKEMGGGNTRYNRAAGVDANLALGRNLQVNSFLAKTATPGLDGKDLAYYGRIAYRDPSWNVYLNHETVGDSFNPEVGFVQRRGVRATKAYFSPTPRPGKAGIRMLEPMWIVTYLTDQTNRMIYRTNHFMLGTWLDDGSFINVIYQKNLDVLDEPFKIQSVTIPPGTYRFDELNLTYNTSPSRRIYERFTWTPQQFYGGTSQEISTALGVRASSRFSTELQYRRNAATLPYGDFTINLAILRVDYTFTTRATLRSLTQYSSSTHDVTNSIRFNFIYRPGSDLYVVYNDLHRTGISPGAFAPSDRQFVVKMTYLLQR